MRYTFLFFLLLAVNSCSSPDKTDEMILSYLAEISEIDASAIQLLEVNDPKPGLFGDSLKMLKADFEQKKEEEKFQLGLLISQTESDLGSISDATAKEKASANFESAQAALEALDGDCSGTYLEPLYKRITEMESRKDEVVFQIIEGKWTGQDGEAKDFHLIANKDLTRIIGEVGR